MYLKRSFSKTTLLGLLFLASFSFCLKSVLAEYLEEIEVIRAFEFEDYQFLKNAGPEAADMLGHLYRKETNLDKKVKIAHTLNRIGIKSEIAREALQEDLQTKDQMLRIAVQYAIGKISSDDVVVQELLKNMRSDPNPYFRDKAACALTNDQPHLTEKQKVVLYKELIESLSDPKDDVRKIAALSLQMQTGQTKGYGFNRPLPMRKLSIYRWKQWIAEYEKEISE